MKRRFYNRVALLLWRDVDGYEPETGCYSNDHNVSLRTRFRRFQHWIADGWRKHWQWWVRTIIATFAAVGAIVPLYLHLSEPSQQVNTHAAELFLQCIEQSNCIIRIEPIRQADNNVVTRLNGAGSDMDIATQEATNE